MIVQTLEIEDNCTGIYSNSKFLFSEYEKEIISAKCGWSYSEDFSEKEQSMLFAKLYSPDGKITSLVSGDIRQELETVETLIRSQKEAALTAKIDFSEMCFFDVLPDHLLYKWFSVRERVIANTLENLEKPSHYDILHKIHVLTSSISKQDICVNNSLERVKYDIFSSATGRLSTERGSFPILNISKEERVGITPKNDMFLELDLNGAEIRTLLALSGKQQPNHDIHEYNKEVLTGGSTRKETKARFFAWLYNPEAVDKDLEKLYNKNAYREFYEEGYITTPFGRKLEVDERRALNYLTQSTTSDIVLENAYKIMKFLKGKKSFVAFTMHDSVVLDFCKEEHGLVNEIKDIFEINMFGRFLSTVNIGKNYGNLKEIKVD